MFGVIDIFEAIATLTWPILILILTFSDATTLV